MWCPYGPKSTLHCDITLFMGCILEFDVDEPYMPDGTVCHLGSVTFLEVSVERVWQHFPSVARVEFDVYTYKYCIVLRDTVQGYITCFCTHSG